MYEMVLYFLQFSSKYFYRNMFTHYPVYSSSNIAEVYFIVTAYSRIKVFTDCFCVLF